MPFRPPQLLPFWEHVLRRRDVVVVLRVLPIWERFATNLQSIRFVPRLLPFVEHVGMSCRAECGCIAFSR